MNFKATILNPLALSKTPTRGLCRRVQSPILLILGLLAALPTNAMHQRPASRTQTALKWGAIATAGTAAVVWGFSAIKSHYEQAFISAVRGLDLDRVRKLIKMPFLNVNARDARGYTALHWLAFATTNFSELESGLLDPMTYLVGTDRRINFEKLNNRIRLVAQAILEHPQIDVNLQTLPQPAVYACGITFAPQPHDRTALIIAAETGNMGLVEELVKRPEIDVNARDSSGYTAFTNSIFRSHASDSEYDREQKITEQRISIFLLNHPNTDADFSAILHDPNNRYFKAVFARRARNLLERQIFTNAHDEQDNEELKKENLTPEARTKLETVIAQFQASN